MWTWSRAAATSSRSVSNGRKSSANPHGAVLCTVFFRPKSQTQKGKRRKIYRDNRDNSKEISKSLILMSLFVPVNILFYRDRAGTEPGQLYIHEILICCILRGSDGGQRA